MALGGWETEGASAPVLALPPLDLPPAQGEPGVSRSFARRALLSVLLLAGVPLLAVLVIVTLVLVNVATIWAGRIFPILVIATLVVAAGVGRGLIAAVRRPPQPDDELLIPEGQEPGIYALIGELAREVGTEPPDRIVLVPEVNAYVNEFGPFLGLKRGLRTLAIGAPLLDALDVTELRAVLAHELGHFAGGDTKLGPLAFRTEQSLVHIIVALGDRVTALPFVWYFTFQRRVSASARRDQELVADRAAVRLAGRQATADALWAVEIAARGQHVLQAQYLIPLLDTGGRPRELAGGLRSLLTAPGRIQELVALDENDADVDPWASHPPTPTRIARVAAIADTGTIQRDPRAARVILHDPERWIEAVNRQWLDLIDRHAGRLLTEVPWSAWADQVVAPLERSRVADVDAALARLGLAPGFESVRTALTSGRDRDLAAALAAQGWRAHGTASRELMLSVAITSSVARHLAEGAAAAWTLSWTGDPELVLADGQVVALRVPSEQAARGDWSAVEAIVASVGPARAGEVAGVGTTGAGAGTLAPPPGAPPIPSASPDPAPYPPPPSPPFERAAEPWRWQASMPGRYPGQKHIVRLQPDGIGVDALAVRFGDVTHASIRIKPETTTSFRVEIELIASSGESAKVLVKTSNDKARAGASMVAAYLWDLLGAMVAPRLAEEGFVRIRNGETLEIGGLSFSAHGVADPKRPAGALSWDRVSHVRSSGGQLAIEATDGASLFARDGSQDEFLVPAIVPLLKAFFS